MLTKWPDIGGFHDVRKSCRKYPHILGSRTQVWYRPKIKIHGSNAAIQVRDGRAYAQSRT
jgi:hypothetical protein